MNDKLRIGFVGLATVISGALLATQSIINGQLSQRIGSGIFAATVSFVIGLIVVGIYAALAPKARAGVTRLFHELMEGQLPLWVTLGGVVGALVVVAQAVTVPIMGVTVFTTSFIAGQLVGALWIDTTELPPGGKKPISKWRIIGVAIVIAAVVLTSLGAFTIGFGWGWPLLPFAIGSLYGFQQSANGRIKIATRSAAAATFMNFGMGSLFLALISVILTLAGAEWQALPQLPAETWLLLGGPLGVLVIGMGAWAVEHLGVLLLSLLVLVGNMGGSLVIDVIAGHKDTALSPMNLLAVVLVVLGTVVAAIRPRKHTEETPAPAAGSQTAPPAQTDAADKGARTDSPAAAEAKTPAAQESDHAAKAGAASGPVSGGKQHGGHSR